MRSVAFAGCAAWPPPLQRSVQASLLLFSLAPSPPSLPCFLSPSTFHVSMLELVASFHPSRHHDPGTPLRSDTLVSFISDLQIWIMRLILQPSLLAVVFVALLASFASVSAGEYLLFTCSWNYTSNKQSLQCGFWVACVFDCNVMEISALRFLEFTSSHRSLSLIFIIHLHREVI